MASFNVKGIEKLIRDLEKKSEAPDKVKKQLIEKSAKETLNQMKIDAPKDSGDGAEYLKIAEERSGDGYNFIDIGINKDNWEKCDHLVYQHYGFEHYKSGKKVIPHYLWMDKSFKKSSKNVKKIIMEGLIKELKL